MAEGSETKDDGTSINFLNVVTGDGDFGCTEEELNSLVLKAKLSKSTPYTLVSIMGCQSSGKSTLLNLLFGTQFREMDAKTGRGQTTKGVWLDCGPQATDILVMDLEACLYALALAEILMINTWEKDIGRYTASNYGILKTIFEVNLQVFQNERSKTLLLFVIRDHDEDTPLTALQGKLMEGIDRIWEEVAKPDKFKDSTLDTFFEFVFVSLPHKKHQAKEFEAGVAALRKRFLDPSSSDYLLSRPFHGNKSVPVDGFGHYAKSVWETIKSNNDLNLPSQREMLATYRCDEVSASAYSGFQAAVAPLKERAVRSPEPIPGIGQELSNAVHAALDAYDAVAFKYLEEIAQKKRVLLLSKLSDGCHEIFNQQMQLATRIGAHAFQRNLERELPSDASEPSVDWERIIHKYREEALEALAAAAKGDLECRLEDLVAAERLSQLSKLGPAAESLARKELAGRLGSLLHAPQEDVWAELGKLQATVLETLIDAFKHLFKVYSCSASETAHFEKVIRSKLRAQIRLSVEQHVQQMGTKLIRTFEKLFRLDENGMPRRWSANEDIHSRFIRARDKALKLLDLFAEFRLPMDDATQEESGDRKRSRSKDEDMTLISVDQRRDLEETFTVQITAMLREAQQEQERNMAKIPVWLILLLVYFGFDDIADLLMNPLKLVLVIIVGGGFYVLWQMGLLGPARTILESAYRQAAAFVGTQLQQLGQQQQQQQHLQAAPKESKKDQ